MIDDTYLDDLDFTIIKHLQKDGRKSFTEIASELNVAVSTIRNRYNKLVEGKVLRIIGRAEPEKMNLHSYSRIMIAIKPVCKTNMVLEKLKKIAELSFLAQTSGKYHIELNVMCKNNKHLLKTVNKINNIEGVSELQITSYLNVLKWGQ
ncbi:MAG: Lrp/AsnC family transcriptional regulator [Tenacibaculum sp.]